jgi:flagellin
MAITGLTNSSALNTIGQLHKHTENATDAIASMSSGLRSTKASKDSSSTAISALIKSNTSVLNQAKLSANNAIGLIQVATGGINNIKDLITSMSTLAAQATDGSLDDTSRLLIDNEYQQMAKQVDDVANRTRWNGVSLLNGGAGTGSIAAAVAAASTGVVAGPANTLAGTMNAAATMGFITGSVESATVTGAPGAYEVTVKVGGQTFVARGVSPTGGGILSLVSTVDSGSIIALDYAAAVGGITSAATFQSALQQTLGLGAGAARASFLSQATAVNNGLTGLTAGTNTAPGTYAFRYDANSGYITLTNGQQKWTKSISTTGAAQSITFDNGITATFDGTFAVGTAITQVIFQVDANPNNQTSLTFQLAEKATDTLQVDISGASTSALGLSGTSVDTLSNALAATPLLTNALKSVNQSYSLLGAQQKRLESTVTNLDTQIENLTAARSNYEDADIAQVMTDFTQATTMAALANVALSQSNQLTQQLVSIVRG